MSELKEVTTKSGAVIKESWCRKCASMRPASEFYDAVDCGFIDTLMIMSVCKDCVQDLYDKLFEENQSMEKSIHKLCISLNIKFSNEAVSATRAHITTLMESGKNVKAIFSIYKMKLLATQKSMDKSGMEDNTYEDVGTIFTSQVINTKEIPIPEETQIFWGKDVSREHIEFLEREYTNFKQTHSTSSYAEVVLLKQVCFTMLNIRIMQQAGDDATKEVKQLQDLMKNLAISPNNVISGSGDKAQDSLGNWIRDIEASEPAQWLKSDPRGDMFRDVANVEKYFQDYFVRPLKNAIGISKDFNIDDEDVELLEGTSDEDEFLDSILPPEDKGE